MAEKSIEERRQALERKQAQIKEQLRLLAARKVAADRKLDARRKIVVGACCIGAAEATLHHRDWLLAVLRNAPRRPFDAPIIEAMIEQLENSAPTTEQEG